MSVGLVLDDIAIAKGKTELLRVNAHIAPGSIFTLMGPSGSGKSTLINAISGFLPRAFTCSGTATLDGENVLGLPPEKRRVGVLFQDPLLFPHLSVIENIVFALPPGGRGAERRDTALKLLCAVGLQDCTERDPATLSGGQKARVALMRVIASRPRALLLDEPFSKLDSALRQSVREFVFETARAENLPTLLVTHDRDDAEAADGQIMRLSG